jgi:hypothetical protein
MSGSTLPRSLRLLDLAALVVGYGMAALLVRALWRTSGAPTVVEALFLAFEYLWLGLAMGGPLVLLIDRRAHPPPGGPPQYTWAELAWLLIGGYWLGLTLLVAPSRLPVNPLLGVFPIVGALALRLFGRRRPVPTTNRPPWTHRVAIGLLLTWPLAWADLILLSKTML